MTNGFVQRFMLCTSTIHMIVAMDTAAIPAQNTTYELVQMLLLIGKDQFHIRPAIMPSAPPPKRPRIRSFSGRLVPIHCPARLPSMAVPMAGIVERMPSGSHVRLFTHVWFPRPKRVESRKKRSQYAAIVFGALPSVRAPRVPVSGTGSSVITNQ